MEGDEEDMAGTKTRTQRRMEKKQALTLLVLVLIVSLASFTLGVMVGRRGAERDMAQRYDEPRRIMVAEVPRTQQQPAVEAVTPEETKPAEEEQLTFYDNLSTDETVPLGSGINLPPKEEKPAVAEKQPEVAPVEKVPQPKVAKVEKVSPKPVQKEEPVATLTVSDTPPKSVADGTFSVQVGSFASVSDAGRLKKSLVAKGYPAFIAEADLGAKGIWYRVRLGPYADSDQAKEAMRIADKKDKIKGFVSRL